MRTLLAIIALLLFPAFAEARPVCGPATSKTLLSSKDARLYTLSKTVYGCSRGVRPIALGTKVTQRALVGHQAAVVDRGALRFFDLTHRAPSGGRTRWNAPRTTVRRIALNASGDGAWIEQDADGQKAVRWNPDEEPEDTGRNIDSTFLHVADGTLSWRKGGTIKLDGVDRRELGDQDAAPGTLGTAGGVALSSRGGHVIARYKRGREVDLGASLSPDLHEDVAGGIDAIRVSGSTVAVRDNSTVSARSARGELRVYDLVRGTSHKPCDAHAIWNFVVTPDGAAACSAVVDMLGGNTVNRIISEGTVLDEGDATVTDLESRGGKLVWRHGTEERTAPLPTVSHGPA